MYTSSTVRVFTVDNELHWEATILILVKQNTS